MTAVTTKQIAFRSSEYDEALRLRYEVLRKPLGLQYKKEDLDLEVDSFHFAAFAENQIVGYIMLTPQSNNVMKMRQVAVSPHRQGHGIGRKLVAASEEFARKEGFEWIKLNAREVAVKFYLTLGYEIEGDEFIEVGVPHRLMKKMIRNQQL